ncbi:Piso0_002597 [Millerozyma farinosa CBS 7064]|uniref:Conserved oligomeric Golgi complex subunit 8 n=1 Tax=Pichia sorbitophila (strain ATCC MYA-4447 / BCRC 22081 / CBS 7064 / NBRC 10061 / NRRL Y-12695) TaxID=559304 RepID=G8YD15_PICSO|nr:Piso0_002597 [Millerozyma farinosa CBS 7064]
MDILIDTLVSGLDPTLQQKITSDSELRDESKKYLQEMLLNTELLSTETYTTNTTTGRSSDRKRTLTEEIAELDEDQRKLGLKLISITNEKQDMIIDVSNDISLIRKRLDKDFNDVTNSMINTIGMSGSNNSHRFEVQRNDKLNSSIKSDSTILSNIDSVLDILELPTICRLCILQGNYQEALEVSMLVQSFTIRFPKISILNKILQQVQVELKQMVKGLVRLLNTNLKQNQIVKIFQILRRLDVLNGDIIGISETYGKVLDRGVKDKFLKLIFLNSRYKFIYSEIQNLQPLLSYSSLTYVKRVIQVFREHLFSSLTIYSAVFEGPHNLEKDNQFENDTMVSEFIQNIVLLLIEKIKIYFNDTVDTVDDVVKSQKDGIMLQLLYLCKSLSKFGVDFETIIIHELCYGKDNIIAEEDWLHNLAKLKRLRA